ncbi:hypothetical protein Slin15195_G005950 [Septoria linicola]|uniref:Uncharacterized protein n=1 Tax=Septoria linicola TaxID=215465 RepID=A0A9Q9AM17_9PEZI|nr:hypothetical protein Slin15195_G005950 [Septoria linicola]
MSGGMPFVVLSPSLTAHEMFSTKPALLRAITTVAMFHDLPRQQTQVRELIRDLSDRIMMKGEKSIDVLQAIIVFVTWAHPHMFWSQQVTNLLHLATAITIDTSLDRNLQPACFNVTPRTHSMEENRILLGLFYLSSTLSSSFRKIDATPFTRHMEICLNNLEHNRECDSDIFLVQTVRLQRVIESIHTTNPSSAPAKIYRKAFQADLARLRQSDPYMEDSTFLRLHYLSAEIQMWELSLNEVVEDTGKPLSSVDLYSLVSAIKAFLDVFFSIPTSAYLLAPFAVFGQFAHAFIALTKLASLDVDGWDLATLNHEVNFLEVIEETARRFDETVRSFVDGIAVDNDAFGKWAQRVRYMKGVYESKFGDDQEQGQGTQPNEKLPRTPDNTGHPTPPDDILNVDFFSSLDADFWSAVDFTTDLGFPATDASLVQ